MNKKLQTLCLALLIFSFSKVSGQTITRSVVASSAETLKSANLNITFVIGEPVADYYTDHINRKYLTVGFGQPDTELKQILELYPEKPIMVYPNPSKTGLVKVAFNDIPEAAYSLEIIDAAGQVLQIQNVTYSRNGSLYVPLDLSSYGRGVYFIRLKNGQTVAGQVKLIRN